MNNIQKQGLQGAAFILFLFAAFYGLMRHYTAPPPTAHDESEGQSIFDDMGIVDNDTLLDTDEPPRVVVAAMYTPVNSKPVSTWHRKDGQPNYFRIVMLETKRREAMGHPGKELTRYKDGSEWAIGYGNHIKYLSKDWQRVIKRQGDRVTEKQARQLMYATFDNLEKQIKADLPKLTEGQRWAVKSLAFNWGYGNVKRSKLWPLLRKGTQGDKIAKVWTRCHSRTENHRISRRMEIALWNGQTPKVIEAGKHAYSHIARRGDFKHYQ